MFVITLFILLGYYSFIAISRKKNTNTFTVYSNYIIYINKYSFIINIYI